MLEWSIYRIVRPESHRGIRIIDFLAESHEVFVRQTREALDMIATIDSRRFDRVREHVKTILNLPSVRYASYQRPLRVCSINLSSLNFEVEPDFASKFYACIIVHEATHGYLFSKYLPQTRHTVDQIERICTHEAVRFALRFKDTNFDWPAFLWSWTVTDGNQ